MGGGAHQGMAGGEGPAQRGAASGPSSAVLTLTTSRKPCQDADTGMTYPLTAVVQAAGHRYAGCAAPPGQGVGPRR